MNRKMTLSSNTHKQGLLKFPFILNVIISFLFALNAMAQISSNEIVLPRSVPDPIEPVNRVIWGFNRAVLKDVIQPTAMVYRTVVIKPVRTKIANFSRNLLYPASLLNNLLQERWSGAWKETERFFCNTTAGAAGFFDVSTSWHIPRSDANFGQTLGKWGWNPACFLVLPFAGPSNERDTLGMVADSAANPLVYLTPYSFHLNRPLTYFAPYTYYAMFAGYNRVSDSVDESLRFMQCEADPYSVVQYAWTFVSNSRMADLRVQGKTDDSTLETLESVFFTFKDPAFPGRGTTRSAFIPATGKRLKFTFWLQPGKANVVYIVP